jgi:hypothetical protein
MRALRSLATVLNVQMYPPIVPSRRSMFGYHRKYGQLHQEQSVSGLTGQHATVNQSLRQERSSLLDASWLT